MARQCAGRDEESTNCHKLKEIAMDYTNTLEQLEAMTGEDLDDTLYVTAENLPPGYIITIAIVSEQFSYGMIDKDGNTVHCQEIDDRSNALPVVHDPPSTGLDLISLVKEARRREGE